MADPALVAIKDINPERLTEIHAASFPRAWSEADFARVMSGGASGLALVMEEAPVGLVLWRVAADEAEILTIAVSPDHRRQGAGRRLLCGAFQVLSSEAVRQVYLEVADDNLAALQLYRAFGFAAVGRRKGYYQRDHGAVDAQVLQRALNTEGH